MFNISLAKMTNHLIERLTNRLPALGPALLAGSVILAATDAVEARDLVRGQALFKEHCEQCHGAGGYPSMPGVPDFTRGDGLMQPDIALEQVIRNGRNASPGFEGILTDTEIADLITYLRSLF